MSEQESVFLSICSGYDCSISASSEVPLKNDTIRICPETVSKIKIQSESPHFTFCSVDAMENDIIENGYLNIELPKGFIEQNFVVTYADYCGSVYNVEVHVSEVDENMCDVVACNRDIIFIDDEFYSFLNNMTDILARQEIQAAFDLHSGDLNLGAGDAVTFYPGFSVSDTAALQVNMEECND
jgi:hypothetical protein